MNRPFDLSRRHCLWLIVGGLLLPTSAWTARLRPPSRERNAILDRVAGLITQREGASALGLAYLHGHPHEAAASRLLGQLVMSVERSDEGLLAMPEDGLKDLLARRMQLDFAEKKVMRVQGWILSTTEVRLCALTTLVGRVRV